MSALDCSASHHVQLLDGTALTAFEAELERCFEASGEPFLSRHPRWLKVLQRSLGHVPFCLICTHDKAGEGEHLFSAILPLAWVKSVLFGSFLVGLPYVNYGGVLGDLTQAQVLVTKAIDLADKLGVRYLELRHEKPIDHPGLPQTLTKKVHMRRALPGNPQELWRELSPKVRNQVRKAEKLGIEVQWGRQELLDEFYRVFAHNMRDLGTPVFPKKFFAAILQEFPEAEIGVARDRTRPLAVGLLLHGAGVTEIPSASSLRQWNWTCANMQLYWAALKRAIERGQRQFDFGRSTFESSTYRFKKQWGAQPFPAHWQYHVRRGEVGQLQPDNPRFRVAIGIWRRLPVWLTRWIGPWIVRGIP